MTIAQTMHLAHCDASEAVKAACIIYQNLHGQKSPEPARNAGSPAILQNSDEGSDSGDDGAVRTTPTKRGRNRASEGAHLSPG